MLLLLLRFPHRQLLISQSVTALLHCSWFKNVHNYRNSNDFVDCATFKVYICLDPGKVPTLGPARRGMYSPGPLPMERPCASLLYHPARKAIEKFNQEPEIGPDQTIRSVSTKQKPKISIR